MPNNIYFKKKYKYNLHCINIIGAFSASWTAANNINENSKETNDSFKYIIFLTLL